MSFELEQLREATEKYKYHDARARGLAETRMGTEKRICRG